MQSDNPFAGQGYLFQVLNQFQSLSLSHHFSPPGVPLPSGTWENPISYNGEIIGIDKAISIGKNVGFTAYSHVNHRHMTAYKPSTYVDMLLQDVGYSSLCYIVDSFWLSALYIVVCIY